MKKYKERAKHYIHKGYTLGKDGVNHYIQTSHKSLRFEILNLVAIVFVIAFLIGSIVTGFLNKIGIGTHEYTDYLGNKEYIQSEIQEVAKMLNNTGYISVSGIAESEDVYRYMEELETLDTPEGDKVVRFAQYIVESVHLHMGDRTYGYDQVLDPYSGEVTDSMKKLYDELKVLQLSGEWSNTIVQQKLYDYYMAAHELELFIDERIQKSMDNLLYLRDYMTSYTVYLMDNKGNVIYPDTYVNQMNIEVLTKQIQDRNYRDQYIGYLQPVVVGTSIYHFFVEGEVKEQIIRSHSDVPGVVGTLVGLGVFVYLIFRLTARKIRYIEYLAQCLDKIATGRLDYQIEVQGSDELAGVAKNMKHMQHQLKTQMAKRDQSERTKNELITNVAHDLRTPLTSIIGYIGLVKGENYQDKEEAKRYLDIAYSKSERLKVLIEDLFEYTKLTNKATALKMENVSLALLMNQLIEEVHPQAEEQGITIKTLVKADESAAYVDIMKMARVFDNLLSNAIKYNEGQHPIQVIVQSQQGFIYTTVRNKCTHVTKADVDKLFERFYRTDTSRNSNTGGSGLGLAIAKNIVDLHGGKIWAQLDNDMISFTVKLRQI